ncbi:MAG: hypothetical protein ABR612_12550 [Chromatocurvus sp.]
MFAQVQFSGRCTFQAGAMAFTDVWISLSEIAMKKFPSAYAHVAVPMWILRAAGRVMFSRPLSSRILMQSLNLSEEMQ